MPPARPPALFRLISRGLALCALAWAGVAGTGAARAFETVVIDAGHGGSDPGSVWYGIQEKNLTLDLAKKMAALLRAKGYEVILTRKDDTYVGLGDRGVIANKYPDAVFVSVHFNAIINRDITGVETYYMSPDGQKLGKLVQDQLMRKLNTKDRGVKPKNLKVLRDTKCTAILIEGGFISNRWENQRCSANWYRQILAEEIVKGLMRYRG